MKKIIIPVIALSILLSGCWDLVESEKLGLVTLIGIDSSKNDQIKVVVHELPEQKQASGGQQGGAATKMPVTIHEAVAPTISEAVEKMNATNFHRTYLAHANALILSEELVSSKGIGTFIDYFERTPQIRRNTWLLISMEGQFDRIFSNSTNLEEGNDTGKIIKGIIANRIRNSFLSVNSLGDFLNLLWETGSEPYTSGISLIEIKTGKSIQAASSSETTNYDLSIGNTAVFKKDKLAGWMDNTESMGILWAKGGMKGGFIPIRVDGKELSLQIIRTDSDIKPVISNGKMQMNIRVHVLSNIGESQVNLDYTDEQIIKKIENLQAEEVKKQILAALDKSRHLKSDIFGFGNYIFGKFPKYWQQIEASGYDYYKNITVNIDVSSKIDQVRLIRKTYKY